MQILKDYSEKLVAIQLFKNEHAQIFQDLENLESELDILSGQLKDEVKEKQQDQENDTVKVLYVEKFRKFYDYDAFLDFATHEEQKILQKSKGIVSEIDKEVFDECVKQGLIKVETKQACFKEEPLTPAVIIKNKI